MHSLHILCKEKEKNDKSQKNIYIFYIKRGFFSTRYLPT